MQLEARTQFVVVVVVCSTPMTSNYLHADPWISLASLGPWSDLDSLGDGCWLTDVRVWDRNSLDTSLRPFPLVATERKSNRDKGKANAEHVLHLPLYPRISPTRLSRVY